MHADGGEAGRVDRIAPKSLPLQRVKPEEGRLKAILWYFSGQGQLHHGGFIDVGGGR